MKFLPKKKHDSFVPNLSILRQSVLELRTVYNNMDDMEFCLWYDKRYGVKWQEVKKILRSVESE